MCGCYHIGQNSKTQLFTWLIFKWKYCNTVLSLLETFVDSEIHLSVSFSFLSLILVLSLHFSFTYRLMKQCKSNPSIKWVLYYDIISELLICILWSFPHLLCFRGLCGPRIGLVNSLAIFLNRSMKKPYMRIKKFPINTSKNPINWLKVPQGREFFPIIISSFLNRNLNLSFSSNLKVK